MKFQKRLDKAINKNNSLLCIGLDPDRKKIPSHLLEQQDPIFEFNKAIIDSTHDLVCAYKPNIAYYSAQGSDGLKSLQETIRYIHNNYADIPVILDAKRADIGNTSEKYALELFRIFGADAVTVSPYLGFDSIEPFLKHRDKGVIILCRTSNHGAEDFQDLEINGEPLYIKVAKKIKEWNLQYKNCLMVIGATWPQQLKEVRKVTDDIFFLVPGIGSQHGDLENTIRYGVNKKGSGLIISASRSIIYASSQLDFANSARTEALRLKESINKYR
ncbi:MAG: orotidine-5'-phosphate decarboxylase [Candidatus Levybacteria bacterium]|nr:orotidine-5'-phosphate decarboxylase [Candidatus Levybacteria bacterium]MDZ4228219.1 orotidine-5'-phosphate decarboxylase [Candidatus Levybacteria bacterium]